MLILGLFTGEECSIIHAGKARQPFSQRAVVQPKTARVLAFHDTQRQVGGLKETYSNMQPVGSGGIWQTGSRKPTHS